MTSTQQYIELFTRREARLIARLPEGHVMPTRLTDWQVWVQDPTVYLNELRNYVERIELKG